MPGLRPLPPPAVITPTRIVELHGDECVDPLFSNDAQLVTRWPKAVRGRALFSRIVELHGDACVDPLFDELLCDTERAPVDQLPVTGVEPDIELLLSSIHVPLATTRLAGEPYGTVSAVVLAVDGHGLQFMQERSFGQSRSVRTVRRAAHVPLFWYSRISDLAAAAKDEDPIHRRYTSTTLDRHSASAR